jgi:uncharacterized protein (DUF1499 family)
MKLVTGVFALLLFVGIGFALHVYGRPFGFWGGVARASGSGADWGAVDFATLQRRATPNDFLICPENFCPRAKSDAPPPVFDVSADDLLNHLTALALAGPRTEELYTTAALRRRFVQRSFVMRFPDIIDASAIAIDDAHSTLAIYSRSVVGRGDFGVNRARVERWLAALRAR